LDNLQDDLLPILEIGKPKKEKQKHKRKLKENRKENQKKKLVKKQQKHIKYINQ
jgi:hypothetical protein